jgi:hypothetical protein
MPHAGSFHHLCICHTPRDRPSSSFRVEMPCGHLWQGGEEDPPAEQRRKLTIRGNQTQVAVSPIKGNSVRTAESNRPCWMSKMNYLKKLIFKGCPYKKFESIFPTARNLPTAPSSPPSRPLDMWGGVEVQGGIHPGHLHCAHGPRGLRITWTTISFLCT